MILTLKELAEHLKVNERTILRMRENGQIEGVKIGGQWRFNGSQIDRMLFPSASPSDEHIVIPQSPVGIPLSRTMDESRVIMNLHGTTIEDVIEELTNPKIFANLVLDIRDLQEKCIARERILSTAVGNGIAVPHPRDPIPTLQMPGCIVYGYSKKGVDFNAPDGKPVHFFFLLCSQNIELHLHMMRYLASILRNPQFIEACQKAAKPAAAAHTLSLAQAATDPTSEPTSYQQLLKLSLFYISSIYLPLSHGIRRKHLSRKTT